MKNLLLTCCALISVFILQSCEYKYIYTYEIYNQNFTPIKVESLYTEEGMEGKKIDTLIEAGESVILLKTDHSWEGKGGPFKFPIKYEFEFIKISKFDTVFAKRDYLDDEEWEYYDGNYSITITDEDFK